MRMTWIPNGANVALVAALLTIDALAADSPPPAPSAPAPSIAAPQPIDREKLREELLKMTPEERKAKVEQLREQRRKEQGVTAAPPVNPERARLQEELKNLPPAEREARIRQLREREDARLAEIQKRREELQKLTPEQREVRIREMREQAANSPDRKMYRNPNAPENEAQAKAMRSQIETRRAALLNKRQQGTLTAEEENQLNRLENVLKRLDEASRASTPPTATAPPAVPAPARQP